MGSLYSLVYIILAPFVFSSSMASSIPAIPNLSTTTLSFDDGYTQLFGDSNLMLHRDGKTVHLSLDQRTGSGFASQDQYLHGFFSASIKLPSDYAAGVVVAFYLSNGDVFKRTHDELDFEFLGNVRGKEWRVQTNVYGNGSTGTGREERYAFWFDPTEDFHQYSILWTRQRIIFYIDNIPIREVVRSATKEGDFFPSKPMSLYATIWDGSNWATSGGRHKANYKYAPFVAKFGDLVLHGCAVTSTCEASGADLYSPAASLTTEQRATMTNFRKQHMTYSYCYDRERYPTPLADCSTVSTRESSPRLRWSNAGHRLRGKRHRRSHYTAI